MGLKRLVKKAGKVAKRSVKFQGKALLAPLKFTKKNPELVASVVGATFTGGLGGLTTLAKKTLAAKLKLGEQVGEGVLTGGPSEGQRALDSFGPVDTSDPFASAEEGFIPGLPNGVLLIGGAALVALLLFRK